MPHGLDTPVEELQEVSGGELQRLALARALFRRPDLIVLDEPDANLDEAGETALRKAIADAKARGATVLVASYRTETLEDVDDILVIRNGRIFDIGPKDEVVARFGRTPADADHPVQEAAA